MSKQIDFLKRCIALNLQSGGLLHLLDRIEELERKVASRDAEVVSLTNQRDYEYVRAENAEQERDQFEQERDQLREHVTMLRDALLTCSVGDFSTGHVIPPSFDEKLVEEALAATDPK